MRKPLKLLQFLFIISISTLLALVPLATESNESNVVDAAGVGLIGGATTDSSFEDGILSIGIQGGSAVSLSIGQTYYAQTQLPSSLGHLLEHPEIRDHITLKYSVPAPVLGFIPISDETEGDFLQFDLTNNIVSGGVEIPINVSLIGVYEFVFEIDIAALNESIPLDTYDFKIEVGEDQLDLDLLVFSDNMTSLTFGYTPPNEENNEDPDEGPNENTDGANTSTNVGVSFLPGDEAPPVLDPSNPDESFEPNPENPADPPDLPTGNIGYLTLDYVSSFSFGSQEISSDTQIYESSVLRPFIQVSDRRGTAEGWGVTASLSDFTAGSESEEGSSLPGARLTLDGGSLQTSVESPSPYAYQGIELHAGGEEVPVLWANAGTGTGTWTNRWFSSQETAERNDNVTLEVPAGSATIGEHSGTITWSLIDAPGQ